eukprot:9477927-Pyramimonas_sp.AAC.4
MPPFIIWLIIQRPRAAIVHCVGNLTFHERRQLPRCHLHEGVDRAVSRTPTIAKRALFHDPQQVTPVGQQVNDADPEDTER